VAHRFGEAVVVELAPDGQPQAFTWRGQRYIVRVIGTWALRTGWWDPSERAERSYYRCEDSAHGIFELYHDTVNNVWVLDVVLD
jgi:hypothetical protein